MLIPAPPKYPKRPSRRRRKTSTPPAGLTITSVTINSGVSSQLIVTFSGAITWDGSTVPTAFKAFTQDGYMDSCIGVISVGADSIEVEFNAGVDLAAAWELLSAMDGITPSVSFPQTGVVT